jgi:hypothetical protein
VHNIYMELSVLAMRRVVYVNRREPDSGWFHEQIKKGALEVVGDYTDAQSFML